MPDYDDTFLTHCADMEKRGTRSYAPSHLVRLQHPKRRRFKWLPSSVYQRVAHNAPQPPLVQHLVMGIAEQNGDHATTPTSPSPQPGFGVTSSHHKHSLRGNKFARRAQSFKDEIMEKFARTPNNTHKRSHSPNSSRVKSANKSLTMGGNHKTPDTATLKPIHDLAYHVRQVKTGLIHFKELVAKKKPELLSGNGTVLLETVNTVLNAIKSLHLNEHSSALISATTQVNMALGKLIMLCDQVLLSDCEVTSATLSADNVAEVVDQIDVAIRNLVKIANEQSAERDLQKTSSNTLQRPTIDVAGQRTSLPDIPLTPSEREILEKSSSQCMRASHSTESILRDSSPPPKPPLPVRNRNPPPLPPKRPPTGDRNHNNNNNHHNNNNHFINNTFISVNNRPTLGDHDFDSNMLLTSAGGLDRMSMRSRSPDDNSSLVSASSLDSALNHSREEDEIRALTMEPYLVEEPKELDATRKYSRKNDLLDLNSCAPIFSNIDTEKNQRNSNESGFASLSHSTRGSTVSTACIQQQHASQSWSTSFTTDQHLTTFAQSSTSSNTSSSCVVSTQQQHFVSTSSFAEHGRAHTNSVESFQVENIPMDKVKSEGDDERPELPKKTRSISMQKDLFSSSQQEQFEVSRQIITASKHVSLCEQRPPLPAKKKHIIAYMEIFSNCSQSSQQIGEFPRHSLHTCNVSAGGTGMVAMGSTSSTAEHHSTHRRHISHSQTMSLSPLHHQTICEATDLHGPTICEIFDPTRTEESKPALPPKRNRNNGASNRHIITLASNSETPPPVSPKLPKHPKPASASFTTSTLHNDQLAATAAAPTPTTHTHSPSSQTASADQPRSTTPPSPSKNGQDARVTVNTTPSFNRNTACSGDDPEPTLTYRRCAPSVVVVAPAAQPIGDCRSAKSISQVVIDAEATTPPPLLDDTDQEEPVVLRNNQQEPELSILSENDIVQYLVLKKPDEEGPDVKGGYVDALIVHATQAQKISESSFGEAFITTFRTFISPLDLINKLVFRYTTYSCRLNELKTATEAFSLLVRVVNDLTAPDIGCEHLTVLVEFVNQLICSGHLMYAKTLREQVLGKIELYKKYKYLATNTEILPSRAIVTNPPTLLDLKSSDIAAQMTLLDAELFRKIDIPEVLIYAQEQCEERSPHLAQFTQHFNKMSYWARSQILRQEDAKDREKYVSKFIKIMKNLRKLNNYNSFLALLSAVASAPIRRLDWHKTITECLQDYSALIDNTSSFRAYRLALAETSPPCIPYIGLVLQDLTFVHIGNPDYLSDGVVNFSKRWTQHTIVMNMKRFKIGSYEFKKNERIIAFFDNFENFLCEDTVWQISETIKPRQSRKQNLS